MRHLFNIISRSFEIKKFILRQIDKCLQQTIMEDYGNSMLVCLIANRTLQMSRIDELFKIFRPQKSISLSKSFHLFPITLIIYNPTSSLFSGEMWT